MPVDEDIAQIDAEIAALKEMRSALLRFQEWKKNRTNGNERHEKAIAPKATAGFPLKSVEIGEKPALYGNKTEIVTEALRHVTKDVFNLDDVAASVAELGFKMHRQDISFVLSRFKKRLGKLKSAEDAGYPEGMFGPGFLVKVPGWDIQP